MRLRTVLWLHNHPKIGRVVDFLDDLTPNFVKDFYTLVRWDIPNYIRNLYYFRRVLTSYVWSAHCLIEATHAHFKQLKEIHTGPNYPYVRSKNQAKKTIRVLTTIVALCERLGCGKPDYRNYDDPRYIALIWKGARYEKFVDEKGRRMTRWNPDIGLTPEERVLMDTLRKNHHRNNGREAKMLTAYLGKYLDRYDL